MVARVYGVAQHARFDHASHNLQTIGVDEIQKVFFLAILVFILELRFGFWMFDSEQAVVQPCGKWHAAFGADPVDHAARFLGVCKQFTNQPSHLARIVTHDLCALHHARTAQPHTPTEGQTLVPRWRLEREVFALDEDFFGQRHIPSGKVSRDALAVRQWHAAVARVFHDILRVVRHRHRAAHRKIDQRHAQWAQHRHDPRGAGVEVIADRVFKRRQVNGAVRAGHADASGESANRVGSHAASALRGNRRHARIIPTTDQARFDQFFELAFADHGVLEAATPKLVLMRVADKRGVIQMLEQPIVNRAVVHELEAAQAVCDAVSGVVDRLREVVERVDAPSVALTVMRGVQDAVQPRIAQFHVRVRQINFGSEQMSAVGIRPRSHCRKQLEVFTHSPRAVRAGRASLRGRAAQARHFIGGHAVHVSQAFFDQLHRALVHGFKII